MNGDMSRNSTKSFRNLFIGWTHNSLVDLGSKCSSLVPSSPSQHWLQIFFFEKRFYCVGGGKGITFLGPVVINFF